jgi:hypothetical protein
MHGFCSDSTARRNIIRKCNSPHCCSTTVPHALERGSRLSAAFQSGSPGGVKQPVPHHAAKSWSKLDKALGRTSAWAGRSALRPIPRLGLRGVLRCVQRRQRGVYQVLRGGDGSCREWGLGGDMGDLGNR